MQGERGGERRAVGECLVGAKVSNAIGFLAHEASGTANVTVSGAGSTWTNSASLEIGLSGAGTLKIESGGTVSNTEGHIGSRATGAAGTVNVSGGASSWKNSGDLYVGSAGTGVLTIENGGAVSNVDGIIAYANTGSVTVSGADASGHVSTWTNTGDLYVGYGHTGSLTIENGGIVKNANAVLGLDNTSNGSMVVVSGAGSTWTNSGGIFIGNEGTGTLTIADGGKVSATGIDLAEEAGGSGTINIGAAAGAAAASAGTLDAASINFINGTGTLNFNHTDAITLATALASTGSGTHALNHYAGTTTLTGDSSAFKGVATVEGGALQIAQGGKLGGSSGVIGSGSGTNGFVTVTATSDKLVISAPPVPPSIRSAAAIFFGA